MRRPGSIVSSLPLALVLACSGGGEESAGDASASVGVTIASVTITGMTATASASAGTESESGATDGSGSDSKGSTGSAGSTSATGATSDDSAASADPPKWDLGIAPDASVGCGEGGGVADTSFIWIPGTSDGTVAKIDTRTLVEVARYAIGPSGGNESASRTAVSADGRYVVVNNRGTGRSTAVAANLADCIDQNQDGVITTSQSAADIKPWGGDECVVWSITYPDWSGSYQHGPRGITWTLGTWNEPTCSFVDAKVWLGYLGGGGEAHLVRVDGKTGALEENLIVPGWNGQGYAPYGGALDPQQRPWFTGLRGELVRIDTDQNPITVTRINQPGNIQSYGMTVDPNGNPWMAGCSGPVSTYDIATQQWISIAGTSACHRGMAIDHNFHAWVASNGPCELVEIDAENRTLVAHHQLAPCSTAIGVSVDVDGYVWLVDQEGWAWKIDPDNVPAAQMIPVSAVHYVYSDMTGGQLQGIINPPG